MLEPAPSIIEAIRDGLLDEETEVLNVQAVEVAAERRNDRCWPALMVAAQLRDGGRVVEAVWATGALGGPIVAVDSAAREYSSWGAAAKGNSRMGGIKDMFATYPEVEGARRVLRGT